MKEFNFIHPTCPMDVADQLLDGWPAAKGFHPIATGFAFKFILPEWTMADIALSIGLFPSLTQARKNGWADPIPPGFTMKKMRKQGSILCIVNISREVWESFNLEEDV